MMVDHLRALDAKDLLEGLTLTNVHPIKARRRMNLLSFPHREVIHDGNVMALLHQGVHNMRPDKTGSSRNQYPHETSRIDRVFRFLTRNSQLKTRNFQIAFLWMNPFHRLSQRILRSKNNDQLLI